VLLLHGTLDRNVDYIQSERLLAKLRSAGASADLITRIWTISSMTRTRAANCCAEASPS
jgi:hypothetical protein